MPSLKQRLDALEPRKTRRPAYRMLIDETQAQALSRLGISANADVLLIERTIVEVGDEH